MTWNIFAKTSLLLVALFLSTTAYAEPAWIDVRSELEHRIDSINGDVRISHGEIVQELSKILPDKNAEIHLYCRSGGRAGKAMAALQAAGYSNVSNAGSIDDARNQRGLSH
ncbi:rhodanese-like domain-containing protein [Zhongshania borealis]|uniref:Rhodanese domain-containing protein n=1 Tax=Zhongshania borealis TaxID=889488 RepID=A0ABP7WMZ5_9GAMM